MHTPEIGPREVTAKVATVRSPAKASALKRLHFCDSDGKFQLSRPGQEHRVQRVVLENNHQAAWPSYAPHFAKR